MHHPDDHHPDDHHPDDHHPDDHHPDDMDVQHVQPYQASKSYRCPGCDHDIAPGVGHEVVVPREAPDLRRHWHTPCWRAAATRRPTRRWRPQRT